jgi:queuine tRNA-ribosyltransferase
MTFKVLKKSKKSRARLGSYKTNHGSIKTPFFMPVATQGTIKQSSATDMRKLKAQILLSNTYHLMLRPGEKMIKRFGGLHKFMDWHGPILTDSGGFQIFSLAGGKSKTGKSLVKMTKDGVYFKSYIDGREYYLTPEKSLQIQADLGVDIAVALDECVALPAKRRYIEKSIELTSLWAKKTLAYREKIIAKKNYFPLSHCVIQGGLDKELRIKSLHDLIDISNDFKNGWDGYNIGGLSVGESAEEMYSVLDYLTPEMPNDKPRYLMGVGYPDNILNAVKLGVDMFDCVIPTREGRHGRLFLRNTKTNLNSKNFYKTINISNSKFANSKITINSNSKLPELKNLTLAYLHYLFKIKEPLGARLASLSNLEFYLDLMREIRENIRVNTL